MQFKCEESEATKYDKKISILAFQDKLMMINREYSIS